MPREFKTTKARKTKMVNYMKRLGIRETDTCPIYWSVDSQDDYYYYWHFKHRGIRYKIGISKINNKVIGGKI